EPVVIKMLAMSRDKQSDTFADYIAGLRIVPVAISYELDPCDAMKARELHQLATHGSYRKGEQEDIESIGKGIAGQKGRVHVAFGTPLAGGLETPEAVAAEVDRQVISGFCLHPTNLYAYARLYGAAAPLPPNARREAGDCTEAEFNARIDAMPEEQRPFALGIYANAVVSKLSAAGQPVPSPC
ncbi:MAG: glycerol acyltransferase, partial [Halioglobus sp.]|nr:glycerol acyltransferase [Halioglobus sp.]